MKLAITLGLSVLTSIAAQAADLSVKNPVYKAPPVAAYTYNWTGLWADAYFSYSANFTGAVTDIGGVSTIDLNQIAHGPGVGGGLEWLYQGANTGWVAGIGADIGYMNLQQTGVLNMAPGTTLSLNNGAPATGNVLSLSNATNYLGSADVILGYAVQPNLLAYLRGGLAFGGQKPNLSAALLCGTAANCTQAANDTAVGYDIGGGLKWGLPGTKVALTLEGKYAHLGDKSLTIPGANGTTLATSTVKGDIFKQTLGLGYNFTAN